MPPNIDEFFLECARRARKAELPPPVPPKPFLKWAGGKTQLIEDIEEILPRGIQTYFEPFLGGGAVFFHLANTQRIEAAVLNDWNSELMDTYRIVRDFPDDLIPVLAAMKEQYQKNPSETFRFWRRQNPRDLGPLQRASRFIFLNRTAFNGMYRVSKKRGRFNVPWGKYKNPTICNEPLIRACSKTLNQSVILKHGDFVDAVQGAKPGDLVYFDPPYVPLTATSNFTSYTSDGFDIDDQHRLAVLFRRLAEDGVAVIASNSNTEIVQELYKGFEMNIVQARRNINSKGNKRGPVEELLIVGRPARQAKQMLCIPLSDR